MSQLLMSQALEAAPECRDALPDTAVVLPPPVSVAPVPTGNRPPPAGRESPDPPPGSVIVDPSLVFFTALPDSPAAEISNQTTGAGHPPMPSAPPPVEPVGLQPPPAANHAAWLVILRGSQHPRGHVEPMTFGRRLRYRIGVGPTCAIVLSNQGVSQEHIEIGLDAGRGCFFIADLGSPSGTYIQPPGMELRQVAGTADLPDGSVVWLGREQMRFLFRCY